MNGALALVVVGSLLVVPAHRAETVPTTELFTIGDYAAGQLIEWAVPEGVTEVRTTAAGGNGGTSGTRTGGQGATIAFAIAVTEGQMLSIVLGDDGLADGTGGAGYAAGGTGLKSAGAVAARQSCWTAIPWSWRLAAEEQALRPVMAAGATAACPLVPRARATPDSGARMATAGSTSLRGVAPAGPDSRAPAATSAATAEPAEARDGAEAALAARSATVAVVAPTPRHSTRPPTDCAVTSPVAVRSLSTMTPSFPRHPPPRRPSSRSRSSCSASTRRSSASAPASCSPPESRSSSPTASCDHVVAAVVSDVLRAASDGTRVVIRYRLHGGAEGATDAVGYVSGRTETHIVVATTRGLSTIAFTDVIAAKEVPPPPAPRH